MRLSTERGRDDARALEMLHAAFDSGVTFLDTANAYCWDATEAGHSERLIARAIATWSGDRSRIQVATKGGLTRPDGRWVADGRARHLLAACEASRIALGVERIHLYQLHGLDPRTPLSTSVRALASLKRDGRVEQIGLCNVNVGQIEEARDALTDFRGASGAERLARRQPSEWRRRATPHQRHSTHRVRPLGGPQRIRRTLVDPLL
jgi:aryl-alcohol dehydrogenase-like predicted oxidoreductase